MSSLNFLQPTSETILRVRKGLNLDEERTKEAVDGIKKWLALQPHLPDDEDDCRLERWLIRCKNNMEKTKQTLDLYYSLRTLTPELMSGWDVNEPWFESTHEHGYVIIMNKLTPDLDRVSVTGVTDASTEDMDAMDLFKGLLLSLEIRMNEDYYNKDVFILDFKNITIGHISKFTLPIIRKFIICLLRGYNTRIRAIHFVNTPPYADALIFIVKSLMKPKLAARIHVHGNDHSNLHKLVPKECLPAEMGGEGGTIQENYDMWLKKVVSYRDWFLQQEERKSDESRRPNGGMNSGDMFGFDGSFRKLTID